MEMSSAIYSERRFTDQYLPNELVKRGMASMQNPRTAGGGGTTSALHLHVEDYLYAVDGMDVWRAIESWVRKILRPLVPLGHRGGRRRRAAGVVGRRSPVWPRRPPT